MLLLLGKLYIFHRVSPDNVSRRLWVRAPPDAVSWVVSVSFDEVNVSDRR